MTRILFLALFFSICQFLEAQTNIQLSFNLLHNKKPVKNESPLVSKTGDTLSVEILKCYISLIELKLKTGKIFKEKNSFHLLDFENTSTVNLHLNSGPLGEIDYITFNLGIDSTTNVSGALGGDLDPSKGMYWAWQSGYINFKLQGTSSKCLTRKNQYQFHLGGYLSPYCALRKIKLVFQKESKQNINIAIELDDFFNKIDLSKTNTVMIPCKEAVMLSDLACKIFSIQE